MVIAVRDPSLILLIGCSGSGKSTFARRHFRASEILSSDFCRKLVCDDESNQAATEDAFAILHSILSRRLRRRRTTVVDATNVQPSSRAPLLKIGQEHQVPLIGIMFDLPSDVCHVQNTVRPFRQVRAEVIEQQQAELRNSWEQLKTEGFEVIFTLKTASAIENAIVLRSYS